MQKILIFVLLFFSTSFDLVARQGFEMIDSLKKELKSYPSPTVKIDLFIQLSEALMDYYPDESIKYANDAIEASLKSQDSSRIAKSYAQLSNAYSFSSNPPDDAIEYAEKSIKIFQKLDDHKGLTFAYNALAGLYSSQGFFDKALEYNILSLEQNRILEDKPQISRSLNNIGYTYFRLAEYQKSIEYHTENLQLNKEISDTLGVGFTFYNLGLVYEANSDLEKAIKNFSDALNIFESVGNLRMIAATYNAIGNIYASQNDFDMANNMYDNALEIYQAKGDYRGIAYILNNKGDTFYKKGNYDIAYQLFNTAYELRLSIDDNFEIGNSLRNLGKVQRQLNKFEDAFNSYKSSIDYAKLSSDKLGELESYVGIGNLLKNYKSYYEEAIHYLFLAEELAKEINVKSQLKDIYLLLNHYYHELGSINQAYLYLSKANILKDSLFNVEKEKQIAEAINAFANQQKDEEISLKDQLLAEQRLSLERQYEITALTISIFLIFLLVIYLIFSRYRLRQKNIRLAAENKEIAIQSELKIREEADTVVNYFLTSLFGLKEIDEILWDITKNCVNKLGLEDCVIYLIDENSNELEQKAAYGTKNPDQNEIHNKINIKIGEGIVGTVAKTGIPLIVNDTSQDDRYIIDDKRRLSEICVPIIIRDKIIGVIDSENSEKGFYKEHHLKTLSIIASICAGKIAQVLADEEAEMARLMQQEADRIKIIDQAKTAFFANISHEFRTPLNLILGPLYKKHDNITTSELAMMKENALSLLRLVNQLLDLARLEVGELSISLLRGDILHQLRTLSSYFDSVAFSNGINYKVDISDEEFIARYDHDKIEKIFYNLLSNAIKFTPPQGEVKVAVEIKNDILILLVADSGIGIDKNEIKYIFEKFYQTDSSRTRKYEGSGIGLSLTKELLELMNGQIEVESELNVGTTFRVQIPLIPVSEDEEVNENVKQKDVFHYSQASNQSVSELNILPFDESLRESRPIVLMVEDSKDLRKFVIENLSDEYRFIQANNGVLGLEMALQQLPDLIISDIMMPDMDGIEFTEKVKNNQITSHIPLLMLTARLDQGIRKESFSMGADQFLTKPFELNELKIRMKSLIDQRNKLKKSFSKEIFLRPKDVKINDFDAIFLEKAIEIIEKHISDEGFSVDKMQKEIGMSRMQLHRKLKALTNKSTSEFIRYIRLQRASVLLKSSGIQITEVAYSVGFSHLSYFGKCFKEQFGVLPSDYKDVD